MERQPAPEPGDTARLGQLAAHWREAPPEIRQDILTAAAAVQDAPEPGARSPEPGARSPEPGARSPEPGARSPEPGGRVAHLLETLGRLNLPDTPDSAP
ncbi:hypothetical protein [Streptomyces sp. NPDC052179]|uniref:hypothetical protein n=1 Tax=Streptomyces sp. NPDC052179 TaxID=3155680 RepID=UPI00341DC8B8